MAAVVDHVAMHADHCQVVLGGAMENHMRRLADAVQDLAICGSPVAAIQKCRDPFFLHRTLTSADLPALAVADHYPADGKPWMAKPVCSSGGTGITRTGEDSPARVPATDHVYFQQSIAGPVVGVTFVADSRQCRYLGSAWQIVEPLGQNEFAYHGSIGPVELADSMVESLRDIGESLRQACGLVGWFGVDFVLQDQTPWLLEVNPRYTASMEIHERATGQSLFARHLAGCKNKSSTEGDERKHSGMFGKRYVFNDLKRTLAIDAELHLQLQDSGRGMLPKVTDIPREGTVIQPGQPICTVWSAGDDAESINLELVRKVRYLLIRLS